MLKFLLKFSIIFALFLWNTSAYYYKSYQLENGSKELVSKYDFSTYKLEEEITRKEFVETLCSWYVDYKAKKAVKIDYSKYKKLDNSKVFTDVDLKSDFWKKLSYFASIWAFSKNEKFNPNWKIDQKAFFTVMRRLWILYSMRGCSSLKICEKELTNQTPFNKWVYYRYASKILDKSLRKRFTKPEDFIKLWYKPMLSPRYNFPILRQSLNWCYAYTVRNIMKYKHWIGYYITKIQDEIWKKPSELWYYSNMAKFDKVAQVEKKNYYDIETFITAIQSWEPVSMSYILEYIDRSWKKKKVGHIVAAYSFDEKWIWVAETVSNSRKRIPWKTFFNSYWKTVYYRMFLYTYNPQNSWSEADLKREKQKNFIAWEH